MKSGLTDDSKLITVAHLRTYYSQLIGADSPDVIRKKSLRERQRKTAQECCDDSHQGFVNKRNKIIYIT